MPTNGFCQDNYIDAVTGAASQNVASREQESALPAIVEENRAQHFLLAADTIILEPGNSRVCLKGSVQLPWMNHALYFIGSQIPLKGIGTKEPYRLSFQYSQAIVWSNTLAIIPDAKESGYIEMDCKGIKTVAIKGEVEFCRSVLIPELPNGSPAPEPYRAHGKFNIVASSFDDMLAEISISRVQLPVLPDFSIQVNKVFLDLSDTHNPPGLERIASVPEDMQANWQGVWIDQASIFFPPGFKEGNRRMEVGIRNFIIDRQGVSGKVYSAIQKSISISDWQLRIDTIQIELERDRLRSAHFNGLIALPLQRSVELRYQSRIEEYGDITFILYPEKPLAMSFGRGELKLEKGSHLTMQKFGSGYGLIACLHGQMSILDTDGKGLQLPALVFKDLYLSTEKPHIRVNQFGMANAQTKLGAFELHVHKLNAKASEILELQFDASVSLMEASSGGFSARGGIRMRLEKHAGKWNIKETSVDRLAIKVSNAAYKLQGEIGFYKNDAQWGDGFSGKILMEVKPQIKVSAEARFGMFQSQHYWMVNAYSKLPAPLPFFGPLGLSGIGGGLAYRMRCENPDAQQNRAYVVDLSKGIYIQAQIETVTIPIEQTFNARVLFEILFNRNGSIARSGLFGNGKIMANPQSNSAPLSATVAITYDVPSATLHGNFGFRVDYPYVLEGIHSNKQAGEIVFHIAPNKWYLHAGRPSSRLGVRMPLLQKADITAYLMVGHDLEPIPPPPPEVMDLVGRDLNLGRDDAALGNGVGFAFGAMLDINSGKQKFLIFYGSFHALAGFDLLIRNYGQTAHCSGQTGTVGIDGWFVKGQAYAYAQGEVGIDVDVWGIKGQFAILEVSAAICLQATLPNPSYFRGNVGGKYSILTGLIEGDCQFQVQFGTQCHIVQDVALNSLEIIRDITPTDGTSEVTTLEDPIVFFEYPIETSFRQEDINGNSHLFKVTLDRIIFERHGTAIEYDTILSEDKRTLILKTKQAYESENDYFISLSVSLLEWTNNTWTPCKIQNHPIIDASSTSFKTAKAIDKLDSTMVLYQYPLREQQYFHIKERSDNYVVLNKDMPEIFDDASLQACYILLTDTIKVAAYYEEGKIQWNQPLLETEKTYTLALTHSRLNVIYTFWFKTSKFGTLKERVSQWQVTNAFNLPDRLNPSKRDVRVSYSAKEWITKEEWEQKLIAAELGNNSWWSNQLTPFLYKTIEQDRITHLSLHSEKALLGIEPLFNTALTKVHTYNLSYQDYIFSQSIIAERIAAGAAVSSSAIRLLMAPLPVMGSGQYPLVFHYTFPDTQKGSSQSVVFRLN
jgi:hypothetical protein